MNTIPRGTRIDEHEQARPFPHPASAFLSTRRRDDGLAAVLLDDATDSGRNRFPMRRSLLFILLLLLLTLPAPFGFAAGAREEHPLAPDFTLPTTTGTVSLHDFRGKVVYVDFWASWCMPCRESFPWMSVMRDQYSAQGLVILSVNLDKKRDAADAFLERFPASFIVALDPAGKTAEAFHVEAMPTSFIVSRTGRIVYAHEGFELSKASTVEDHIKEALSK
jgi:cytochrome c biogenesis protein CcmG, thiol:disulfide interchange protein DsbE